MQLLHNIARTRNAKSLATALPPAVVASMPQAQQIRRPLSLGSGCPGAFDRAAVKLPLGTRTLQPLLGDEDQVPHDPPCQNRSR